MKSPLGSGPIEGVHVDCIPGLGTIATQDADNVNIDGGILDGVNIGSAVPGPVNGTTGNFTGSVSAGIPRVVKAATGSLSAADLRGCLVSNKGQTDDATISLPAIAEGMHCLVCLETTVAKYWRLDPNGSEVIIFDGTALAGGYYVGIASAVDGAMLSVVARYAETTLVWDVKTIEATWAAQA